MHKLPTLALLALAVFASKDALANPIVIDLAAGPQSHSFAETTSDGATAFLLTSEGAGTMRLYRSDGLPSGTALLDTYPSSGSRPAVFLGATSKGAWFVDTSDQLWLHRGWKGGGLALGKAPSRKGRVAGELPNGSTYFTFEKSLVTGALFRSDGTPQGTGETTEYPYSADAVVTVSAHAFFVETPSYSIVKTDGKTRSVFYSRQTNGLVRTPTRLVTCENRLFVVMNSTDGQSLHVSDGNAQPTLLASPPAFEMTNFRCAGSKMFFFGKTPASGREVWVTDGTASGTHLTKDVNAGAAHAIASTSDWMLSVVDGRLFFTANDGTSGNEPWTTDGTEAGTLRLADLSPGATGPTCMWKTTRGAGTKAYCMIFPDAQPYRIFEAEGTSLVERSAVFHGAEIAMVQGNDDFLALGDRLLLEGGKTNVTGLAELVVVDTKAPLTTTGGVFPPSGKAEPPVDGGVDGGDAGARPEPDAGSEEGEEPALPGAANEDPGAASATTTGCACTAIGAPVTPPGLAAFGLVAVASLFRLRRKAS